MLVAGFLALFVALGALITGSPYNDLSQTLTRVALVICPFLFIASGIGLLSFKNWARLLSIGFLSFVSPFLISLLFDPDSDYGNMSLILKLGYKIFYLSIGIIFLWIVFYLLRPKIKSHFK